MKENSPLRHPLHVMTHRQQCLAVSHYTLIPDSPHAQISLLHGTDKTIWWPGVITTFKVIATKYLVLNTLDNLQAIGTSGLTQLAPTWHSYSQWPLHSWEAMGVIWNYLDYNLSVGVSCLRSYLFPTLKHHFLTVFDSMVCCQELSLQWPDTKLFSKTDILFLGSGLYCWVQRIT